MLAPRSFLLAAGLVFLALPADAATCAPPKWGRALYWPFLRKCRHLHNR